MTIASEITRINGNIADAYTAISTAGGTLPATQNSDNLAAAIATISGGGGGGDTVYAINNTGSTISQGDKVWLNKHNIPSVTGTKYSRLAASTYTTFMMIGNIPYDYNSKNSNLTVFSFSNGEWTGQEVQSNLASSCTNPYFVGAQPIIRGISPTNLNYQKDLIINTDGISQVTPNGYFYIGNDRCVKWVSNKNYSIVEYDHTTGTEGSVLGTFTSSQNTYHNVFIDGNVLMLATLVSNACLMEYYDISDLTAIVKITSVTCPETTTYFYYATGLNVGDYVFFQSKANVNNWEYDTAPTLKIYKIGVNFALETADDLPLQLETLKNTAAVARYDSRTKILTVGTHDNVYFFEFNTTTRQFSQFLLDIAMPTEDVIYADYAYVCAVSGDRTNVAITFRRTSSSSVYPCYKLYKLSNTSDTNWYAEPYGNFNVNTLTGYATGNTQDGKYEVATVLEEDEEEENNYFQE